MHLWSGSFEKNRDVKNIIKVSRNKVYAHIFEISNICIDYCDGILKLFMRTLIMMMKSISSEVLFFCIFLGSSVIQKR